ncbi:MAG: hypothetical protein JWQ73_663 [Variovorax sp.]|nr:hypothetical protein [Variovorax sp.]
MELSTINIGLQAGVILIVFEAGAHAILATLLATPPFKWAMRKRRPGPGIEGPICVCENPRRDVYSGALTVTAFEALHSKQTNWLEFKMRRVVPSDRSLCTPHRKQDIVLPRRLTLKGDPDGFDVCRRGLASSFDAEWDARLVMLTFLKRSH